MSISNVLAGVSFSLLMVLSFEASGAMTRESELGFSACRDRTLRGQMRAALNADYRADLEMLDHLGLTLERSGTSGPCRLAAMYWSGFAHWRFATNAANGDQHSRQDIADQLQRAATILHRALALAPGDIETKIALMGVVQMQPIFLTQGSEEWSNALMEAHTLTKELAAIAGDNPRFLWLRGGQHFWAPKPQGEGPDAALASYYRGLSILHITASAKRNSLAPQWGEVELLMSAAYVHTYRDLPNFSLAQSFADAALRRRSDWVYLKKALMPEINRRRSDSGK